LCVFIQNRNSVYNGASNYTVCTLFGDANFIENYVFVSGKTYLEGNGIYRNQELANNKGKLSPPICEGLSSHHKFW